MQILNYRLYDDDGSPYPFVRSLSTGGKLQPQLIVIHYTGGQTAQSAIDWLVNPKSMVSTHLVIGKDGAITQLVPFDTIAWHAGVSTCKGLTDLNRYSIGIELDYPGPLTQEGAHWVAYFHKVFDGQDILVAPPKFGTKSFGWPHFTPEQIQAAQEISVLLVKTYQIKDVAGHDEIAPGRKWDPGPAFPMESFRMEVINPIGGSSDLAETTGKEISPSPAPSRMATAVYPREKPSQRAGAGVQIHWTEAARRYFSQPPSH